MLDGKEIVHPKFLECCQYAEDEFWYSIFEDFAYGKTPSGTYISKGFLCCSYKGKEFSYKLEKIPAKRLYSEVQALLVGKLGILSTKEQEQKRQIFELTEGSIKESRQTWDKIKKKNFKDYLIENYVLHIQHEFNLSVKQTKDLLAFISMALLFKLIKPKDIDYDGHRINSIAGLTFGRSGSPHTDINFSSLLNNHSDDSKVDERKKVMAEKWPKFLSKLIKV